MRMLLALLALAAVAMAYNRGDVVGGLRRSQHSGWRTEWAPLRRALAPRFAHSHGSRLPSLLQSPSYESDKPFKIAFSFADSRFQTTWITVADGKGSFLKSLRFHFTYTGNDIRAMRVEKQFFAQAEAPDKPEYIDITYDWKEQREADSFAGMVLLLLAGCVASLSVCGCIVADYDRMAARVISRRRNRSD